MTRNKGDRYLGATCFKCGVSLDEEHPLHVAKTLKGKPLKTDRLYCQGCYDALPPEAKP